MLSRSGSPCCERSQRAFAASQVHDPSKSDENEYSITAVGVALLAQLSDEQIVELYGDLERLPRWSPRSTTNLSTLLAKLNETRAAGYAVDDGETYPNVFAYGLVVHRVGNHAQDFSMSVSLLLDEATPKRRAQALEELKGVRDALESGNDLR